MTSWPFWQFWAILGHFRPFPFPSIFLRSLPPGHVPQWSSHSGQLVANLSGAKLWPRNVWCRGKGKANPKRLNLELKILLYTPCILEKGFNFMRTFFFLSKARLATSAFSNEAVVCSLRSSAGLPRRWSFSGADLQRARALLVDPKPKRSIKDPKRLISR